MKISELLKVERKNRNLLLREVAAILAIDQALVSKFENGTRVPTRKQIIKLAQLYELNETDILTEWLSQKILGLLAKEDCATDALRLAEAKLIEPACYTQTIKESATFVDEMINDF